MSRKEKEKIERQIYGEYTKILYYKDVIEVDKKVGNKLTPIKLLLKLQKVKLATDIK
ncbi:MAG: hypothetical protein V1872_07630 [bacterium]